MSQEVQVPVVIVGGGGCGLTLSGFLSNYGIEHVLVEKHNGTSVLPKAHYLNQRTMETLRTHGMVEEILQRTAPTRYMSQVAWQTSLGGSGPMDRRVIHKFECFGGDDGTEYSASYKWVCTSLFQNGLKSDPTTGATHRYALVTCHYSD